MTHLKQAPFDVDDEVTLAAEFTDKTGSPANPATVTLRIKPPTAAVIELDTGDLDNPTVGRFEHKIIMNEGGLWKYRFAGDGIPHIAGEHKFPVHPQTV